MVTTTKVSAWGNSFGVRLPRRILDAANVKDNATLDVRMENGSIMLSPRKSKKKTLKQLLSNIRPISDPEIHAWMNMKPVGKEVW